MFGFTGYWATTMATSNQIPSVSHSMRSVTLPSEKDLRPSPCIDIDDRIMSAIVPFSTEANLADVGLTCPLQPHPFGKLVFAECMPN